jgi:hypothetical protein
MGWRSWSTARQQIVDLAVDLHVDPVEMPLPVREGFHPLDPLLAGLGGEHWANLFHQNRTVS